MSDEELLASLYVALEAQLKGDKVTLAKVQELLKETSAEESSK